MGGVHAFALPEGQEIPAKGIITESGEISGLGALARRRNGGVGCVAAKTRQEQPFTRTGDFRQFHQRFANAENVDCRHGRPFQVVSGSSLPRSLEFCNSALFIRGL